jgi:hypothetical protein
MNEFEKIMDRLSISLGNVSYRNGDISDVGNEIGVAIGEYLSTEKELNDFISGLKHGISLTNGTH